MTQAKNKELTAIFEDMANILEFKGENPFKISAYHKAARVIEGLGEDIKVIFEGGGLLEIPGIGSGIAQKIEEYLTTGKMSKYEEMKKDVPEGLIELLGIQGLGPKTLALVHKELDVRNLLDLERAIQLGSLEGLPGMGQKKVENILRGIRFFRLSKERIPLGLAWPIVLEIIEALKETKIINRISPCGSLRRMRETIGDIDILASGKEGGVIINAFTELELVKEILVKGETKGSILTADGLQIDLRVVDDDSFGAALQYFTGSKAHNIKLREMAKKKGLKINEYGIFKNEKKIGGKEEEEIYRILDLLWVPPELREDLGEIEEAKSGRLPVLVEKREILGDLHVHSDYSDGSSSIMELAKKARELGYKYIAITDHSRSVKYGHGLSIERLLNQIEEISKANQRLKEIRILTGTEVDILKDGTLDFPDEVLEKLDIVIAAIHQGFKQNVTFRMCKAMENPHVDIIAHPTGRLISAREGYEIDTEEVMKKAVEKRVALEINSYYDRLDLSDINTKHAKELGARFVLGSDAHSSQQLEMLRYGLAVARRGWLAKRDLLNTFEPKDFNSIWESLKR